MSDRVSALAGATASGTVQVSEAGLVGMITIRGDLGEAGFQSGIGEVTGLSVPEARRIVGDETKLAWMSPDELLLICDHGEAEAKVTALSTAMAGRHHMAVNVSDARAVITLEGEGAAIREVLAKLTPADLRPGAIGIGEVRRTRLAQVPAAFWLDGEGQATVVCFRSVAEYVFGLLRNASENGSGVGYF